MGWLGRKKVIKFKIIITRYAATCWRWRVERWSDSGYRWVFVDMWQVGTAEDAVDVAHGVVAVEAAARNATAEVYVTGLPS